MEVHGFSNQEKKKKTLLKMLAIEETRKEKHYIFLGLLSDSLLRIL